MTYRLPRPFIADDPSDLSKIIMVERITVGRGGALVFQGRGRSTDGTRGRVKSFEPRADEVASYFQARAGKYGGYMVLHGEEFENETLLWATVKRRLAEESRR